MRDRQSYQILTFKSTGEFVTFYFVQSDSFLKTMHYADYPTIFGSDVGGAKASVPIV